MVAVGAVATAAIVVAIAATHGGSNGKNTTVSNQASPANGGSGSGGSGGSGDSGGSGSSGGSGGSKVAMVWPHAILHDGEVEGKTMFGAEQRWISPDGEPVLFVHVVRGDGKGVLRAVRRDGDRDVAQDVLVHDFGKDEMVVIARDDGELGFQFHSYSTHPNKYLGVRATWTDHKLTITKQQPFNGKEPTPAWLFDPEVNPGPIAAWQSMRGGALSRNNLNGFSHWIDDEPVTVTLDGVKTTEPGKQFLAGMPVDALPVFGNHVACDATGCCHGDSAPLAAWTHVASVCFAMVTAKYPGQGGAVELREPRLRSIEIISPARAR
jgi:hypothetical protein